MKVVIVTVIYDEKIKAIVKQREEVQGGGSDGQVIKRVEGKKGLSTG